MDTASIVAIVVAVISASVGPITVLLMKHFLEQRDKAEANKEIKKTKEHEAWQEEVRSLIAPVAMEVSAIKRDITALKTDVNDVQTDVYNVQTAMKDVKADVATMQKDVVGVKKDMSSMQTDMNNMKNEVAAIKATLEKDKDSTIVSLRSNMKQLRDHYRKQGYADVGDKATWRELYNNYRSLGGNHFKEYVDGWLDEIEALPTEPQHNDTNA